MISTQADRVERFWELHREGCFVIPNPWDAGSAVFLESLGFKALATTSAGFSYTQAKQDKIDGVSLDATLQNQRDIVRVSNLPLNADFQAGYGKSLDDIERNVAMCIEAGVAGFSIEDATGEPGKPLYDLPEAVERIKAARRAIDRSGMRVLLTGRCEAYLVGDATPLETSLERLTAYAAAGADCLFAPRVTKTSDIAALVAVVHPRPLNVLVVSPQSGLTVPILRDLGVRRVSVGSALARTAWGAVVKAAKEIMEQGTFETFGSAAPGNDLNEIFKGQLS